MMFSDDDARALISSIYDAGLDSALWPSVLRQIQSQLGGNNSALATFDADNRVLHSHSEGVDLVHIGTYVSHYRSLDPVFPNVMAGPVGKVWADEMVFSKAELRRTEFHADWCRPANMEHALQAVPLKSDGVKGFIAFARSAKQPSFDERDVEFVASFVPHINRAMRVQLRLAAALLTQDGVSEAFDKVGVNQSLTLTTAALDKVALGLIVIAANGGIVHANTAARALVATGGGIALLGGGTGMATMRPSDQGRLGALIAGALRGRRGSVGGTMTIDREYGLPLDVTVVPLGTEGAGVSPGGALVLLERREPAKAVKSELFRERLGLTDAETRVAAALCDGAGVPAVAARLSISKETARTHLKRIFEKTGASRQAELVLLLNECAAVAGTRASRHGH